MAPAAAVERDGIARARGGGGDEGRRDGHDEHEAVRMRRMGRVFPVGERHRTTPFPAGPGIYSAAASVPAGTRAPSSSAPAGTRCPFAQNASREGGSRAHPRAGTHDGRDDPRSRPRPSRPGGCTESSICALGADAARGPTATHRPRCALQVHDGRRVDPRRRVRHPVAPCPRRDRNGPAGTAPVFRGRASTRSERNPNTGCPAAITAGKTSRSIEICSPADHPRGRRGPADRSPR